ncbi:hypothetical protein C8J56DRAFT_1116046 [Mycena floridula]|nr:hypothetical protein C8J56DRAFT_1116046 [Mycena floridula]
MHYNPGIKPGFSKELPLPTPETIALLDQAPAPKTLNYYIPEDSAAAFFIYRARTDQLYLGCEVYQNSNSQWCMNLRQVRGLLAAHGTAPIRAKENARVRHKYFFIFATLLGVHGKYAFYLQQLRLAHPHYQTIEYKPIPLRVAPGVELTIPHVVEHMFHCGITIARVDDGYNYGRRFIEIFASKLGNHDEETNPGPNHVYNHEWASAKNESDVSISSGIPTGFPGDQVFIATHPVIPFPARGLKPAKGKTIPKPTSKSTKKGKSAGLIQSQVTSATNRLNAVSFGNGIPAFIDRSYPPGFSGHVTHPSYPNFHSNGFNGQFTVPSGFVGPSVMSGAPSFPPPVDTEMKDVSDVGSSMHFSDIINEHACESDDDGHYADARG